MYRDHTYTDIAAVLDWEMCTVGNPWMDLGLTLAYWAHSEEVAEMPFLGMNGTHLPGCPRRDRLVALYQEAYEKQVNAVKPVPADMVYYYVFGNFKIAGIVQQIYARYEAGHTRDKRFAQLHHVVNYLHTRARRAIASGALA